jgi:hypothetical protein
MDVPKGRLSPADDSDEERIRRIVEFWNQLRVCVPVGHLGSLVDSLEQQVTDCLARRGPRDINRAESATAKAMMLVAGQGEP